jgi:hypothetical protein
MQGPTAELVYDDLHFLPNPIACQTHQILIKKPNFFSLFFFGIFGIFVCIRPEAAGCRDQST